MANQELLQVLKSGGEAWNKWRLERGEIKLDLCGADLSGADLSGADLSGADFRGVSRLLGVDHIFEVVHRGPLPKGADLSRATPRAADLRNGESRGTNLSDAILIRANLNGANLNGVDLRGANLSYANLSYAILSYADLREANLREVDLRNADLSNADLSGTDLSGANHYRANLIDASLRGANLRAASLIEADLSGANLSDANLHGTRLERTHLTRVSLSGADLREAIISGTNFADIDLREVKGLEAGRHYGPSGVSFSTIYRSEGRIPEVFLRGCGMPEFLIAQIPSLVAAMQPIQFYSCFISYSSKDQKFAERLHADLQNRGVRCWYAPHDLKIGERIRVGIDESIRVHDKLLLILSKNSIESEWVEKEVETAMERERRQKRTILFPIRLDDAVLKVESGWAADVRRSRNVGDFRRWKSHDTYSKAFERLLRDLKASA